MTRSPEPVSFSLFIEGLNNWLRATLATLWQFLWIFLWSLLFIIPGIIKSLAYSMMPYIVAEYKNISVTDKNAAFGKSFAEKILPDGSVQAVDVQIEPYGFEFVNVISGLEEGEVLKNQGGGL